MISKKEFAAMATVVRAYAKDHREDVPGAFLHSGAFGHLSETEMLDLSKKIEKSPEPTLAGIKRFNNHRNLVFVKAGEIPKVGQHIYVETSWYIDRGEDDFEGGIATVSSVKKVNGKIEIQIKERPHTSYYWDHLSGEQVRLAKEFGKRWSHPDPDLG